MENGAMFGDVAKFVDSTYFDSHKTGTVFTNTGEVYEVEVFASIKTDAFDGMNRVQMDVSSYLEN